MLPRPGRGVISRAEVRIFQRMAGILTLTALLAVQPALDATTINVSGTADVLNGSNGICSLREAVTNANDDIATYGDCAAGSGADTIVIPAGTYLLTLAGDEEWWQTDNAVGDLDLSDSDRTTLSGAGAAATNLDGSDTTRVLHVLEGAVATVSGVTIQQGFDETGGGILNEGTLSLSNSTLSDNEIWGFFGSGGGIRNSGTLATDHVTMTGNVAMRTGANHGGAISNIGTEIHPGIVTVDSSSLADNSAEHGGAISNGGFGSITLTNSTVSGNYGNASGGAVYHISGTTKLIGSTLSDNYGRQGGGMYIISGTVDLVDSNLSGNSSGLGGDGIVSDSFSPSTVNLTDTTLSGTSTGYGPGILVGDGDLFRLENSAVAGYSAGGGIRNWGSLTLTNSRVSDNSSTFYGGGISNHFNAELMLNSSTVSGNTTTADGGGIWNVSTATLSGSTISNNDSTRGGAIFNGGNPALPATVTLTNSTLSGNLATSKGGGIYNWFQTATLSNTTLASNRATDGGGIYNYFYYYHSSGETGGGTVTLAGTLLANGSDDNCNACPAPLLVDLGQNLADDATCVTIPATLTGLAPTLADNGGPTWTHALLDGSTAIDLAGACGLGSDQRGAGRLVPCDSGAFEFLGCPLLELDDQVISTQREFSTCSTALLGPLLLVEGPDGRLIVRAGYLVAIKNGFAVATGAELDLGIDPSLLPP